MNYAEILDIPSVYSSNGDGFYEHDRTCSEGKIEKELTLDEFPAPEILWQRYKKYKGIVADLADFIAQQDVEIKGFSARNIWTMKQFYEIYQRNKKLPSLMAELSWTHNRRIMSLKTAEEREFYLLLCIQKNYSVRELERLINSGTFERTLLVEPKLSETIKQLPQSVEGVFKNSDFWGRTDSIVYKKWANDNKDECKEFCKKFFKILKTVSPEQIPESLINKIIGKYE